MYTVKFFLFFKYKIQYQIIFFITFHITVPVNFKLYKQYVDDPMFG